MNLSNCLNLSSIKSSIDFFFFFLIFLLTSCCSFSDPQAAPYNFQAESISDTQIHIKWERPQQEHLMGDLKGYKISYSQQDMNYEPIKIEDPTKKVSIIIIKIVLQSERYGCNPAKMTGLNPQT